MSPAAVAEAVVPLPAGRLGPWRFSLHSRLFTPSTAVGPKIADLVDARARRVEQKMNQPAVITFSVPGASPTAAEVIELATDVVAYRWNERFGRDDAICQACVTQSQDTITEQAHTVAFTCQDYLAMLKRRFLTLEHAVWVGQDQDTIVAGLLNQANNEGSTNTNATFAPGSELSMTTSRVQPNGASRANSGVARDRTYYGNQNIWEAIYNLSRVQNGFDLDVIPGGLLRLFFPNQGVLNSSFALEYGATVSGVQRTINSTSYANYVRTVNQTVGKDNLATQFYGEAWTNDALDPASNPVGLWMTPDSYTDPSSTIALKQRAQGMVDEMGAMVAEGPRGRRVPLPSYTLTLRPGAYFAGAFNMGDTLTLRVRSGRLNVNTLVQVVGITYQIGDDGQEDVILAVGTPPPNFVQLLTGAASRVSALERKP